MNTNNLPDRTRRHGLRQLAGATLLLAGLGRNAHASMVPDTTLIHRDGRRVRLRSDVWRDRLALVNFVYTSCSSFCGVQSAMLAELQARLGPRLGRDVVLISLSIDPLSDDAARLAEFSRPFKPGPHWWWLTGEPNPVFRLLDALGADRGDPRDHSPLWLAGRATAPERIVGFPAVAQLLAAVSPQTGTEVRR